MINQCVGCTRRPVGKELNSSWWKKLRRLSFKIPKNCFPREKCLQLICILTLYKLTLKWNKGNMLIRAIESQVEKFFKASKYRLLFIWGPRRSGKTTLLEKLSRQYKTPVFNFDLLSDREKF